MRRRPIRNIRAARSTNRRALCARVPESLVKDLIPFVERTYRVQADVSHRAIAGLSSGAAQTVVATTNNLDAFDYIGILSGGARVGDADFQAQVDALAKSGVKPYWTGAGDDDIARLRTLALYKHVKFNHFRNFELLRTAFSRMHRILSMPLRIPHLKLTAFLDKLTS